MVPTIVLAACGIALFCSLGTWQLHRAEQKRALHREFLAAAALPALDIITLEAEPPLWREISAKGVFDARTVLLDNRVRNGKQGYEVYSVFTPERGPAFLVNRGWAQAGPSRDALPSIPVPSGTVMLRGRTAPPPSTGIRLGGGVQFEALGPALWRAQHLDDAGLRTALGLPLATYTVLMENDGIDGLARGWTLPQPDDGKHTAYAVQWFAFAGIALGLAVGALVRRTRKQAGSQ